MRRFIVLFGITLVLLGVRFYDTGLFRFTGGELIVYEGGREQYAPSIFLPTGASVYRIDLHADFDVEQLLLDTQARIVITEMDGRLIYAYSPLLPQSRILHGRRVNIMIHRGKNAVNIGVPILMGSF